jgi:hypothetical protein
VATKTKRKKKRKRIAKAKKKPPPKVERKPGRPTLLTPELTDDLCAFIAAGAYKEQAAIAVGIGYRTFARWMQRGDRADRVAQKLKEGEELPEEEVPYWQFWQRVEEAGATARVSVETQVRRDNPTFWLRNGPGKTRENRQGWTDSMGEAPVDPETGKPKEVDPATLLAKLDGIRDRVLAEQAKKKRKAKPKPRPKPKPKPR